MRGAGDTRQGSGRHWRDPKVLCGSAGEGERRGQGPGNGAVALAPAGNLMQCRACVCGETGSSVRQPFQESHHVFFCSACFAAGE